MREADESNGGRYGDDANEIQAALLRARTMCMTKLLTALLLGLLLFAAGCIPLIPRKQFLSLAMTSRSRGIDVRTA